MAVSIPDPSGAAPDRWPAGHAEPPDQPAERRSSDEGTREDHGHRPAVARRDALRSPSAGRRDAAAGPRSAAEWVTLTISSLIVLGLIGLTTSFYLTNTKTPAVVEVESRLGEVYRAGSRFYLPVTVRNTGGETGEEVRVQVSLTDRSGRTEATEITVSFLAGGGSNKAVAVFGSDPREGQVEAVVMSYLEP